MQASDLALVSMEDLWMEICKRHDVAVLIVSKRVTPVIDSMSFKYAGGKATCVGLCEHVKNVMLSEMK